MKEIKYYKATVYILGKEEQMILNAYSKQESFVILVKIYKNKLESSKVVIKIRDLSYEEKITYGIGGKNYEKKMS